MKTALEKLLATAGEEIKDLRLTVADYGASRGDEAHNRDIVTTLSEKVEYLGPTEKEDLTVELGRRCGEPELVRFALFGGGPLATGAGANRNALLLRHAGKRYATLDDDVSPGFAPVPEGHPPSFFSGLDPSRFRFFVDRNAAREAWQPGNANVAEIHGEWLGRGPSALVDSIPGVCPDLSQAGPDWFSKLQGAHLSIAATVCGFVGDCGMRSNRGYPGLMDASFSELAATEEIYQVNRRNREVFRGVDRLSIGSGEFFFGACNGLDGRELLPPFSPSGRGSDNLFGLMLWHLFDDALVAVLPSVCGHFPSDQKVFPEKWSDAYEVTLGDMMGCLIQHHGRSRPIGLSRAEGLRQFGEWLENLAQWPKRSFEEFLFDQLGQSRSGMIRYFEFRLAQHDVTPSLWEEDVVEILDLLRDWFDQEPAKAILPREGRDNGWDSSTGTVNLQQWLGWYGRLLGAWPLIMDAARDRFAS